MPSPLVNVWELCRLAVIARIEGLALTKPDGTTALPTVAQTWPDEPEGYPATLVTLTKGPPPTPKPAALGLVDAVYPITVALVFRGGWGPNDTSVSFFEDWWERVSSAFAAKSLPVTGCWQVDVVDAAGPSFDQRPGHAQEAAAAAMVLNCKVRKPVGGIPT